MLTHLRLERFKNFNEAELSLGPLTLLVGTNASGKSNLRDAFRFLHGISRGYTLAEIIGQKFGEGGEPQWRGIRGGTREVAYHGGATFALEIALDTEDEEALFNPVRYRIEVEPGSPGGPRVVSERLYLSAAMLFDSHPPENPLQPADAQHIAVRIRSGGHYRKGHVETFISNRPVLSQITERIAERISNPKDAGADQVRRSVKGTLSALRSMRFLDLSPEAMRLPSLPGQIVLGDRGENLSSVLQAICADPTRKEALVQWV